jgi:hypothetical protein
MFAANLIEDEVIIRPQIVQGKDGGEDILLDENAELDPIVLFTALTMGTSMGKTQHQDLASVLSAHSRPLSVPLQCLAENILKESELSIFKLDTIGADLMAPGTLSFCADRVKHTHTVLFLSSQSGCATQGQE